MERMFRDRTMESEEKLMVKEFGILTAMLKQLKQFQGERLELDQNTLREKDNKGTIKAVEEKLSLARQKVEKSARDWEEKKQTCQQQNEVLWDKKEYYKKTAQKAESARRMAITEKQEISVLLQAQSTELAATEAFLSQTDPLSEQEVLQLVQDLNSEVMQIATYLAEDVDETGGQVDQDVIRTVKGICGPKLVAELPRHDPELTEIAIKTTIAKSLLKSGSGTPRMTVLCSTGFTIGSAIPVSLTCTIPRIPVETKGFRRTTSSRKIERTHQNTPQS